jgi:hypothetical protein
MLNKLKDEVNKNGVVFVSKMTGIPMIEIIDKLNLPYKTFEDIEFEDFPMFNGVKSYTEFENGYGVSVIKHKNSYGGIHGLYELGVTKDGNMVYDTPIASDVVGHLTPEAVTEYMVKIQEL